MINVSSNPNKEKNVHISVILLLTENISKNNLEF